MRCEAVSGAEKPHRMWCAFKTLCPREQTANFSRSLEFLFRSHESRETRIACDLAKGASTRLRRNGPATVKIVFCKINLPND